MATLQTRPFAKNYSGLINQSVIAAGILVICITIHDLMKRKRRGKGKSEGTENLGSVESWEFGYLYEGRCWARNPSPPHPRGWPLAWVKSVLKFPEQSMNDLRGVDATLYVRFLRGCWWFVLVHTFTTFLVLFPIHIVFSDGDSPTSMTRASISSLTNNEKGLSLLWIHGIVMFWITFTWVGILLWLIKGGAQLRAMKIDAVKQGAERTRGCHPHPHPQYSFRPSPSLPHGPKEDNNGLQFRTVMVSNIPPNLRSEKELREYFQYYLSRKIAKPAMGVTTSTQPGFLNRFLSYIFNRLRKDPSVKEPLVSDLTAASEDGRNLNLDCREGNQRNQDMVIIDRVSLVRKMTELVSLLDRREEVLRILETAHIKLANKVVSAVSEEMRMRSKGQTVKRSQSKNSIALLNHIKIRKNDDNLEHGEEPEAENRIDLLIRRISPFLTEFRTNESMSNFWSLLFEPLDKNEADGPSTDLITDDVYPPCGCKSPRINDTIWDALLSLPRSVLDPYQPLVHLSSLFRGKTVTAIDYYTAKLNLLTSLITENRARDISGYEPVSTAFVTFASPNDARRACKYLAIHPNNPLVCKVVMAPSYEDIDWIRVMKLPFRVEFVKDWVIDVGVWGFTIFWIFPVSLFVGLVSIQNISAFAPGLKNYFNRHPWQAEFIQSFIPTFLLSLLALLIPLILLLIAKKAHTISTVSALHDIILTRYYKFLVVNVLVFFCVGTVALQSFLVAITGQKTDNNVINVVSASFPTAGPFYVGWLIFTTAVHAGFELTLLGLPLITHANTKHQVTPRKRAVGIRPRTFNFHYWLPNHVLVIHVLLLFATLNPLVIPFGLFYFSIETTVVKNSLLHVYAKNYEANGQRLLIRIIRYSLDGLILAQAVFMAYMIVNKKTYNIVLSVILIASTSFAKLALTRLCRARHEADDIREADIVCGISDSSILTHQNTQTKEEESQVGGHADLASDNHPYAFWTWKLPDRIKFSYSTLPRRPYRRRQPTPFAPSHSMSMGASTSPTSPQSSGPVKSVLSPGTRERSITEEPIPYLNDHSRSVGIVVRQPPHPMWDDECYPDQLYDNPYYTLRIENALWLPRNPCGVLDLDDTVNLHVSIASDAIGGRLGAWMGQISSVASGFSGFTDELVSNICDDGLSSASESSGPLDGTDDISLGRKIATKLKNIDMEHDAETSHARQPSIISRHKERNSMGGRRSSAATAGTPQRPGLAVLEALTLESSSHRPTTVNERPSLSNAFRSLSCPSQPRTRLIGPPPSSIGNRRRANNSRSIYNGFPMIPTFSNHAQYLSPILSLEQPVSSHLHSVSPTGTASMHEVVLSEIIAEEQKAAEDRLLHELEEVEKAKAPRSRLTAWMFARA